MPVRLALQQAEGGFPGAAPSRNRLKLANARLVSPLWHGDNCAGLSGLYAIINAIRLALAHRQRLSAAELHALFVTGLQFMDGRLRPLQCVACGLRLQLWRQLANAMVEAAVRRTGIRMAVERLYVERLSCRYAALAVLERAVVERRVPLMLCQGGRYTVLSGVTTSSLLLFDSGGACWITRRLCGVPGDCEGARHMIYPSSFLALSV